jgi:type II secretory pathway pseudopilin PulG
MNPAFPARSNSRGTAVRARGLVLLALLLAMALSSIVLMAGMEVWSTVRQRALEQELLFVGDQYRQAIQRYYFGAPPGSPRVLPSRLEDLLEDNRYPMPVRHLRRLYPDPITGSADWGVVRFGDRISGVYSLSERTPIKQAEFAPVYRQFNGKTSYREWVFAVSPTGGLPTGSPTPTGKSVGTFAPPPPSPPISQNPS